MSFIAGLLPGLLIGVVIGFTVTTIARHAREVAKALVKGALLVGDGLSELGRRLGAHLGELVAEARSDLERPDELGDAIPPPRNEPPTHRFGGPFP